MTEPPWPIDDINTWTRETFVEHFGGVFEASPWVAEQGWESRPFRDLADLHRRLVAVVRDAPEARQTALIRSHPDLVGRAALAGTLTRESTGEQAAAGLDPGSLSPEEVAEFAEGNAAYRERFAFPFVICARENTKQAILAGLQTRIDHSPADERSIAIAEIAKIAWYRLADLVDHRQTVAVSGPTEASFGACMDDIRYEISYGKLAVPVYRVYGAPLSGLTPIPESRFTGRDNVLVAHEIDVRVLGDNFLPAYTDGDNSTVVATDSMKNVILREALTYDGATLEGFLHRLGRVFLTSYPEMQRIRVSGRELPFAPERIPDGSGAFVESDVLFGRSDGDVGAAMLEMALDADAVVVADHRSGRANLRLLKVTGSAFTAFVRDGNTTLPDRRDRPLYIYLDVHWRYRSVDDMLGPSPATYVASEQVRDVVVAVFHEFVSESIQHLVHEMGLRLFARFSGLTDIWFVAQNRTRDPFFTSETDPRVKVYSDPFPAYGEITLRLTRA